MNKFAKSTAPILAALALCLCLPGKVGAQAAPVTQPGKPAPAPAVKPATAAPVKPLAKAVAQPGQGPSASPASPAKPLAAKPATTPAKPLAPKPVAAKPVAVKPIQIRPAGKPAVPAKAVTPFAAAKPAEKPAAKVEEVKAPAEAAAPDAAADTLVAKRDPFISPLAARASAGGGPVLPPGKAGLVVATVRIDGTVRSADGMIAMVSNPEKHIYFVREGDRLYDGDVESINLDGVTFRENSKDAFGKPVERMVTKRIYQSAGESQ